MCKRYDTNIWGLVSRKSKFLSLLKYLIRKQGVYEAIAIVTKLELKIGLKTPKLKRRKRNLRLTTFKTRQLLKAFYGNWKSHSFKDIIFETRKGIRGRRYFSDFYRNVECRIDVIIWRAGFVLSVNMARQWILSGFVTVNNQVKNIVNYKIGLFDVVSIVDFKAGEVLYNILVRVKLQRNFVISSGRFFFYNYSALEVVYFNYNIMTSLLNPPKLNANLIKTMLK